MLLYPCPPNSCCVRSCAGEYVAHMKYTVFLSAEGVQRVTGGILPNVAPDAICKDEELAGYYNAYAEKVAKKAAKKKKKK